MKIFFEWQAKLNLHLSVLLPTEDSSAFNLSLSSDILFLTSVTLLESSADASEIKPMEAMV